MKKPTPVQPHNCATCGGVEPLYAHHSPGDCIATLRAENERLREVLRWYADEDHYHHPCDPSCCEHLDAQIVSDGGARARAALGGGK